MGWNWISSLPSPSEAPVPVFVAGGALGPDEPGHEDDEHRGAGLGRQLRTVIIEDELFAAWLIEGILEKLGHLVVGIYPTGEEALAANLGDTDLVVVDINLGRGIDGVDTAEVLRRTYGVPVVFCSAYSDEATRRRVANAIPTASLVNKPLSERDLRSAIQAALQAGN